MNVPFNVPYLVGKEQDYISSALMQLHLSGDGSYTRNCEKWIENNLSIKKALLTPSCTAALEMAAILLDLKAGDEVIMPSYTFVSTANAFVLRGAIPVFVDIRRDTLNIDETKIVAAITDKTRAIVVVHYAGVACEMDTIMQIAEEYGLYVVEDAAQAVLSSYKQRPLGSIGHLAAYSFHATKNVVCGEGGALCINDQIFLERAEIIREKGTNRKKFFQGQVDKYTWVDLGSSFLMGETTAAFLLAQLEHATIITKLRLSIWAKYCEVFSDLKFVKTQLIPSHTEHNAHLFYLLFHSEDQKLNVMQSCKKYGISTAPHYVPLHNSPYGNQGTRCSSALHVTEDICNKILRLPMYPSMADQQDYIIDNVLKILNQVCVTS